MNLVELAIVISLMKGHYRWERDDDEWREIGNTFKTWRKANKISLTKVATEIDVSKSYLLKFERGEYMGLRTYIDIWYRMLLTGKSKKFREICRTKRWYNLLWDRYPVPSTAFKPFPKEIIW